MTEFPEMKGFSRRNLYDMRKWYLFYSQGVTNCATACRTIGNQESEQIVPKLVQIPWGHNIRIVSKCKGIDDALFYVRRTIEHNWSRAVLTHQIESGLFEREGKAITNFEATLPEPHSDLANEMLKNPYNFDFLGLTEQHNERELENALVDHVTTVTSPSSS
jgi:predicted nuclease of restriction endonuclease-like (RecB) superfamily